MILPWACYAIAWIAFMHGIHTGQISSFVLAALWFVNFVAILRLGNRNAD